jgi:hypothetical protein
MKLFGRRITLDCFSLLFGPFLLVVVLVNVVQAAVRGTLPVVGWRCCHETYLRVVLLVWLLIKPKASVLVAFVAEAFVRLEVLLCRSRENLVALATAIP